MHKPESVHENEMHKILGIQLDQPIQARRPNLVSINKKQKIRQLEDFAVPAVVKVKESKKKKINK